MPYPENGESAPGKKSAPEENQTRSENAKVQPVVNIIPDDADGSVYGTSPIKRNRRSKRDMGDLLGAVQKEIADVGGKMTIRHLFYRLSGTGTIDKSEKSYSNLCGHLSKWRKAGEIPFSAFVDSTRWYYGSTGYDTVEDALEECAKTYRKNYWGNSAVHLEVWTEKETIASLLSAACRPFGVQVFVCRGFASLSSLYDCAMSWRPHLDCGKRVAVLYFGDHDPSGVRIDRTAAETLRNQFSVDVEFRRVAVTREQIQEYNLPTRPTKTHSPHAAGFEGDSVEIDALDPKTLKGLVTRSVDDFTDPDALRMMKMIEAEERQHLFKLAGIGGASW
jgi:hypothetical protein